MMLWQHLPEHINPVLFAIGSLKVHYYGLSYLAAALTTYCLVIYRLRREKLEFDPKVLTDGVPWAFIGMWLGARLLYVLTHWDARFASQPLAILLPFAWQDGLHYTGIRGMSSHGGFIGLAAAGWVYCKVHKINFWKLCDVLATCVPLGYTWGRIGNFINEDALGRVTALPWGMYFKADPGRLRHPVQLYEAFFEGIVLFAILWAMRKKKRWDGFFIAAYLIGYSLLRFPLEYFRENSKLYFEIISMGQIFCLAGLMCGLAIVLFKKPHGPSR